MSHNVHFVHFSWTDFTTASRHECSWRWTKHQMNNECQWVPQTKMLENWSPPLRIWRAGNHVAWWYSKLMAKLAEAIICIPLTWDTRNQQLSLMTVYSKLESNLNKGLIFQCLLFCLSPDLIRVNTVVRSWSHTGKPVFVMNLINLEILELNEVAAKLYGLHPVIC